MKHSRFLLILGLALPLSSQSCGKKGADTPDPIIHSVSTEFDGNKIVVGKPVKLIGRNFSSVTSDNKVFYGIGLDSVSLPVTESSQNHIVFVAPDVSSKQIIVRVSVKGKESNSVTLEYTEEAVPWEDMPDIDLPGATTIQIRPGIEWTTFHGIWEGQMRNINIVRTRLDEHNSLGIFFDYSHTGLDDLDQKCEYLDAVVGTNGPMACCQFSRVDGVIKHAATDADYWTCNCAMTIDDGAVDIVKVKSNYDAALLPNKNVGCAGPLLVWEGVIQEYPEDNSEDFLKTTHPRTAFGLSKDGKTVVQVAVDGRWTKSGWPSDQTAIGMPTKTLAKFMRGLGCYKAMNFDGGGGTAMWVYGQGNSRNIVNHVCENRWDWNGTVLRATGNAVYVKSDLK